MRLFVAALAVVLFSHSHGLRAQDRTPAENMTIIESPRFGERDTVLRRFEFLLDRFSDLCRGEGAPVHDMLVVSYQQLIDAGLEREESLLDLSNTLYRAAQETRSAGVRPDQVSCAELFSMYVVSRQGGFSQEESRQAAVALAALGGI